MPAESRLTLHTLGVGNAGAAELGNAAAVLERSDAPLLLIDCGFDTVRRYASAYGGALPEAVYITHCHLDHIGGLEGLFYQLIGRPPVRLYVPAPIVALLHGRLGTYPGALAEGGVNFWDHFHLVPVSERFWHAGLRFEVFPTRHHEPDSAFGLALARQFVWSGDTRPIPEVLARVAAGPERVFHDCAEHGNPSHTGLADLLREYPDTLRRRMVLYHYESRHAGDRLRAAGLAVAEPGQRYPLGATPPDDDAGDGGGEGVRSAAC